MQDTDSILSEIYEALETGDAARAREIALRTLGEESVDDPVLWYLTGVASLELSRFEEATRAFEKSIAIDPDDVDTHADLGLARFLDLQFEAAKEAMQKAAKLSPDGPDLRWLQGLLHDRGGEFPDADVAFDAAAASDPERFIKPHRPEDDRFQELLDKTCAELDADLRLKLAETKVEIQTFPEDSWLLAQDVKPDPTLLGVREGSRMILFRRNLEREAADESMLCELIAETLQHQLNEDED